LVKEEVEDTRTAEEWAEIHRRCDKWREEWDAHFYDVGRDGRDEKGIAESRAMFDTAFGYLVGEFEKGSSNIEITFVDSMPAE
jgi:hypothetical protein